MRVDAAGESMTARAVALLRSRRQTLAVAESLTGGLLAATIVDVPGASNAFRGGLVVYATDLKAALAGGPRQRCAADWGLATTGVAGPEQQGGHPVGTVYLGLAGPDGLGLV